MSTSLSKLGRIGQDKCVWKKWTVFRRYHTCFSRARAARRVSEKDADVRTPTPAWSPTTAAAGEQHLAKSSFHYPEYEDMSVDSLTSLDGFLPKRQPGEFPPVGHHQAELPWVTETVEVEEVLREKTEKEYDPLRDGPLRYLGYANELGEAFAAWLPAGGVSLSYAVAVVYVLTDTGDKAFKTYTAATADLVGQPDIPASVDGERLAKVLTTERAVDTVVWQLLASVAIPGYTVHTVVEFAHELLRLVGVAADKGAGPAAGLGPAVEAAASFAGVPSMQLMAAGEKLVPTLMGLLAIPFIVHPIDNGVHAVLNYTLRPVFRTIICRSGGQECGLDICSTAVMMEEFPVLSGKHSKTELLGMLARDVVNLTAAETEPTPVLTRSMDSMDSDDFSSTPLLQPLSQHHSPPTLLPSGAHAGRHLPADLAADALPSDRSA